MIEKEGWFKSADSSVAEHALRRLSHGDDDAIMDLWNLGVRGRIEHLDLKGALLSRTGFPSEESFLHMRQHLPEPGEGTVIALYVKASAILRLLGALDDFVSEHHTWLAPALPTGITKDGESLHRRWEEAVETFERLLSSWEDAQ